MFDAKPDLDMAMANVSQEDSLRRKLSVDALRDRLKGDPNKEKKLREACEGFESIFINKLWQQMRKSVPKEGFLHSKEEEIYQSMFDEEMSKKIASAGGIGLADILYEQLQQQAQLVSRATSPTKATEPIPINAETGLRSPDVETVRPVNVSRIKPLSDVEGQGGESVASDSESFLDGLYTPVDDGVSSPRGASASPPSDARIAAGEPPEPRLTPENMRHLEKPQRPAKAGPIEDRTVVASAGAGFAAARAGLGGSAASGMEETKSMQLTASLPVLEQPVDGVVSSSFGWRNDPFTGKRAYHAGVDYQAPQGTPVHACWDGEVVFAGQRPGYGKVVVLEHTGGWRSFYGHADGLDVSQGEMVKAGRKIASVGSTGRSTGPHLHFELRNEGQAYDPEGLRKTMLARQERGITGS